MYNNILSGIMMYLCIYRKNRQLRILASTSTLLESTTLLVVLE